MPPGVPDGPRHEDVEELLGAYALDAVEPEEAALVERHLATCARCRAEVREHREVAALLANSGADAPEGLWERIAGRLDPGTPDLQLRPVTAPDVGRPGDDAAARGDEADELTRARRDREDRAAGRRRGIGIAQAVAAAAALVIIGLLGAEVRDLHRDVDRLESTAALDRAFQEALAEPGARVVGLASADGAVTSQAVVTPAGDGYLQAAALPRLDEDSTYQLWGLRGDEAVSLGVLGSDPDLVAFQSAARFDALAVSQEAEPGAAGPTLPPVLAGEIPA